MHRLFLFAESVPERVALYAHIASQRIEPYSVPAHEKGDAKIGFQCFQDASGQR